MESFGNNITYFNKEIRCVENALCAHEEDLGKLLTQIFTTYADCSQDNGPFIHYIEMPENQYNYRTLKWEYKDLMDKAEVKYNDLKDTLKFKGNSKV